MALKACVKWQFWGRKILIFALTFSYNGLTLENAGASCRGNWSFPFMLMSSCSPVLSGMDDAKILGKEFFWHKQPWLGGSSVFDESLIRKATQKLMISRLLIIKWQKSNHSNDDVENDQALMVPPHLLKSIWVFWYFVTRFLICIWPLACLWMMLLWNPCSPIDEPFL